jgi:uncharacterized repeat protein (TIGR01451 family)
MAPRPPASRRGLAAATLLPLLLGLLLAALAARPAAAATPGTLKLLGSEPRYSTISFTMPNGQAVSATPGWFRLQLTTSAGTVERRGFCIDALHHIGTGTAYSVTLKTAADDATLASEAMAETAWLLQHAEGLIDAASDEALEAGALQVAVWQLGGQARETTPTNDAKLNARVAALRALATGKRIGGPVAVSASASRSCAGAAPVTLTLTGVPGSTATLGVPAGAGTLSASQVTFGASGTATVTLSRATPGAVTVTARSEGGTLTRLARATGSQTTPQETVVLVPQSFTAATTVTFDDCTPPTAPPDDTPTGPSDTPSDTPSSTPPLTPAPKEGPLVPMPLGGETPAPTTPPSTSPPAVRRPNQSGTLRVTKTGPARARAGARIVYTIRVVNRGTASLSGLSLSDLLPDGMSLTGSLSGGRLKGGRLVWTLGALKPGASRTLRVPVRLDADASGHRCNRVTATATGATPQTATACTRVIASPRSVLPPVTA